MNKKGLKNKIIKASAVIAVFSTSLAAAYFLTPNTVKKGVFNLPDETDADNDSAPHFSQFVTRLTNDIGINGEETENRTYYGMNASFDNFVVSFKKDSNSAINNIRIDGDIDLMMKGLNNINFNLDATIDYNDRTIPLDIGYVNQTVYFGLKDLRIKAGSTTIDELFGNEEDGIESLIYKYFIAAKEEGGINFDFMKFYEETYNGLIDGLFSNLNFSDLGSSMSLSPIEDDQEGMGLKVVEVEKNDGWDFDVTVQMHKFNQETSLMDINDFEISISVDQDLKLKRVDLGQISIANFTISGAIDIEMIEDLQVLAPNDPEYRNYNANYDYVEVINYKGWLQKLANFLDEDNQKFGFDFSLDLDKDTTEIGKIEGSINADFSNLIDLSSYQYVPVNTPNKRAAADLVSRVKDQTKLGIELSLLGQSEEEFANLAIAYADGSGYISLNESIGNNNEQLSVLKAKLETETINWLINELPGMFANLSGDTSSMDSLFSFVTDSTLVSSIKDGDYSAILDVIKSLKNDNDKIELELDISSIGLGNNATVGIVLDSRTGEENKVLNVDVSNIQIGSLALNVSMNSTDYQAIEIGETSNYDSLNFLPSVIDQVSGILDSKQAGFDIEGSVLDENNLGLLINGEGQFDYGNKFGFGDLTIDQYKYQNKGLWYSHKISLDVDNTTSNYNNNNAFFVYGDVDSDENIKGKVTVQSVLDIVDVIKTFLNENKDDPRFTKFIEPIMRMMSMSELSEIINSKNYFRLLKNDIVKSAKRSGDNLDLVIGGAIFSLDSDITIRVQLKEDKIDSLSVINLGLFGKTLNLKISLKEFDSNKQSKINHNDSFIDLSTIALLLKFGINTTKNNYYHLTADISISALLILNIDFNIEVSIVVQGEYVKIYGIIKDAKISSIAQDYLPLVTKSMKSEFTFETYPENDPHRLDGVGGYFHFKTTKDVRLAGTTVKHYKTTSANLLDGNNILTYLLEDFLFIRSSILGDIGSINLSGSEEKEAGNFTNLFTDTGFQYDTNQRLWKTGINLNEITGIDALRELELSIYGSQYENLEKLVVNLNVKALFVTVGVNATITLDNPDPSILDWSSSTQSAFDAINGVNFPEDKLNNPSAYIGY